MYFALKKNQNAYFSLIVNYLLIEIILFSNLSFLLQNMKLSLE